jgi:hypothetical protein
MLEASSRPLGPRGGGGRAPPPRLTNQPEHLPSPRGSRRSQDRLCGRPPTTPSRPPATASRNDPRHTVDRTRPRADPDTSGTSRVGPGTCLGTAGASKAARLALRPEAECSQSPEHRRAGVYSLSAPPRRCRPREPRASSIGSREPLARVARHDPPRPDVWADLGAALWMDAAYERDRPASSEEALKDRTKQHGASRPRTPDLSDSARHTRPSRLSDSRAGTD